MNPAWSVGFLSERMPPAGALGQGKPGVRPVGWWPGTAPAQSRCTVTAEEAVMSEQDLSAYASMWTTERDQWELHRFDDTYLPISKGDPPMASLICDDELADLVITRMLAAGVAVVDASE